MKVIKQKQIGNLIWFNCLKQVRREARKLVCGRARAEEMEEVYLGYMII